MLKITRVKILAHRFLLARNKTALSKLKGVENGSNIQWRGRSYAASIRSDVPKPQSIRKKVSKDERKAMVEAFVKTYRAAHDGKFPTASVLQKNVGGGYYFIRIMLQELDYKSKTSTADGWTETVGNGPIKEAEVSMDVELQNEVDILAGDNVEIGDASDKLLKAEGSPLSSSVAERNSFEAVKKPTVLGGRPGMFEVRDTAENREKEEAEGVSSYFVETESHLLKRETEKISHPSFGNADEKEKLVPSKDLLESDGTKPEAEQHNGSPKPAKNKMDVSCRQTDEAEVPKNSTLWGNLKSLADGLFRMWK